MFVFTSCTNNYIPKARVLASTLKAFHPDWTFCLLLGETPPEGFSLADEPFDRLTTFDQLDIPEYRTWLFRHRVVEICTAAKGPALYHFLAVEGHDKVMYLDPDIMVMGSLAPLERMLDGHDVLLTPHQLAPQETEQSIVDNELVAMRYGVFNLGFAAAARRGDGLRFAAWWRDRLLQYCYDDIPRGLFTDQRWCDLAPAFFPNLHIVRDAGCNAASWNLTDRTITRAEDGTFLANDGPLRFYHFTGFDSGAGDGMTERYAGNMPAVHDLWTLYRERLMASGHEKLGKTPWKYMTFNDGTPITDAMRRVYRDRWDLRQTFPDPFKRPGFLEWYVIECGNPARAFAMRASRKAKGIERRVKHLLDQHGGFPHGIPGVARQVSEWVKKWGVSGVARKVLGIDPHEGVPEETLPLLGFVLDLPKSPACKRLCRILAPANQPVLVIEHDWGGGADAYCRKRIERLLREGRAVIRMRFVRFAQRLEMRACYRSDELRCEVASVRDLADERFPRISEIVVNELMGWHQGVFAQSAPCGAVLDSVRGLARVAACHGARLEYLFHDFYAVCPSMTLLDKDGVYCGLHRDADFCDACGPEGFSVTEWREAWGELLEAADEVVFFSENTRDIVLRAYALRPEQTVIRPHSVEPLGHILDIPAEGPMRVAVVGSIATHKGAEIVQHLADLLERDMPEASIVIFGNLEAKRIPRNVSVLGPYDRANLADMLAEHKVTVGLFPSVWPETFSYVVRELGSAGLPLVCFALGAQAEYVKTLPNGCVADEIRAEAALACLKKLDAARKTTL